MKILVIVLVVAVLGYIAYKFGVMRKNSKRNVGVSDGKTIVVDHTKPDTSKEDELKDRLGDLD